MGKFTKGARVRILSGTNRYLNKLGTIQRADIDVIEYDWWVQLDDDEDGIPVPFKESEMRVIET